jgi:hypothetical protein
VNLVITYSASPPDGIATKTSSLKVLGAEAFGGEVGVSVVRIMSRLFSIELFGLSQLRRQYFVISVVDIKLPLRCCVSPAESPRFCLASGWTNRRQCFARLRYSSTIKTEPLFR